MKKDNHDNILFDNNVYANKNHILDKIKTTNINILLNKVKLNKKEDFKSKIIFLSLLVMVISFFSILSII